MTKRPFYPTSGRRDGTNRDLVEKMVVEALTFLAEDVERLGRFFDSTGLTPMTLRAVAGKPGFDSSLFDYLGSDETILRAFAERFDHDPAEVDAVRLNLARPSREN